MLQTVHVFIFNIVPDVEKLKCNICVYSAINVSDSLKYGTCLKLYYYQCCIQKMKLGEGRGGGWLVMGNMRLLRT